MRAGPSLAYPGANIFDTWLTFMSVYAITQVPLAIAEGILIAIFFDFLISSRPKMTAALIKENLLPKAQTSGWRNE